MNLKTSVDEVHRKIGRNMLLFQQLEGLLKYILSSSQLSGLSSQLEQKQAKHTASTNTQTLGMLVGKYVENILGPESENNEPNPDEITEPYFSFKFRMGHNDEFYNETKNALAKLVDERNALVHHLLPRLDTHSIDSCNEVVEELDAQAEKIRKAIRHMQSIATALQKMRNKMKTLLQSPEGLAILFPNVGRSIQSQSEDDMGEIACGD